MVLKRAICKGDTTTHGGTVIEGLVSYKVLEREVACVGHKVACPLCQGTYPIVEGVLTISINGLNPAVEGMKTACGAVLIASQTALQLES